MNFGLTKIQLLLILRVNLDLDTPFQIHSRWPLRGHRFQGLTGPRLAGSISEACPTLTRSSVLHLKHTFLMPGHTIAQNGLGKLWTNKELKWIFNKGISRNEKALICIGVFLSTVKFSDTLTSRRSYFRTLCKSCDDGALCWGTRS